MSTQVRSMLPLTNYITHEYNQFRCGCHKKTDTEVYWAMLKMEGLTEVDGVAPLLLPPPSLWKKAELLDCYCGSASWTTPAKHCVAPPPTPGVEE